MEVNTRDVFIFLKNLQSHKLLALKLIVCASPGQTFVHLDRVFLGWVSTGTVVMLSHLPHTCRLQARAHAVWELETNVPLARAQVSPQFCTALWLNRKGCKSCKWQMGVGSLNYMWLCMHVHTHTCTQSMQTCTPTGTHIHTSAHAYTYMNTHTCTVTPQAHTHTQVHVHTHTWIHIHARTYMHIHIPSCTGSLPT